MRSVLASDFLTQGPVVPRFEEEVARYCHAERAVAVNSATSALHIACLALGVGPGDEVWTSPNSFVASSNCGLYCGAKVDFVDIDPHTFNLSTAALEEKLANRRSHGGNIPRVVIPVHFAGLSCPMRKIGELAQEYGFYVVEDASHAIGATFDGEPVGSCRFSDITVFSFHPVKIITTGEGGMAVTNNPTLDKRMRAFRSHGITREPGDMTEPSHGPWYYQMLSLGYNYRMTDIQAALGLSQMAKLSSFVETRNTLARNYIHQLRELADEVSPVSWQVCQSTSENRSSYHLFVVRVPAPMHARAFDALRSNGIGANLHYIPIHLQPFYQHLGFHKGQFPESERYYSEAISLPLFPSLEPSDQERVVAVLSQVLKERT